MRPSMIRVMGLLLLLPALGWAQAQVQARGELNTITRVDVRGGTVEITGTRKPSFTTFTMTDPPRLVIDISEAVFSGVPDDVQVGNGVVTAIKTASYGSGEKAIARILIGFTKDVETDMQAQGGKLVVKVLGVGGGEAVAGAQPSEPGARGQVASAQPAQGVTASTAEDGSAAAASKRAADDRLAQEKAAREAEERARADQGAERQQAEADAREATVKAQDDQAAQQKAAAESAQAEKADEARATKAAAEAEKKAAAEAEKQRKAEEARAAAEEKQHKAEEARAAAEAEKQRKAEEARAAAEEKQRKAEEARAARRSEREQKVAMAEAPAPRAAPEQGQALSVSPRRKTLTFVGFKQEPSSSRVYIRTNEPVRYSVTRGGDKSVVLELENTRIGPPNASRFLDTSYFDSVVALVAPERGATKTVRIEIKLKESVPYEAHQDGNEVYIDFQRPSRR